MIDYSIKDKVAIVGIGETRCYKAGQAPVSEFQLALEAIQKAVADADLQIDDIDGFASYSDGCDACTVAAAASAMPRSSFFCTQIPLPLSLSRTGRRALYA
ncbi:MAG TPA: hypothetical protein VNN62_24660 [Methylomirabilota bacterium]|jgi:3-oxoacyl-[acyl-carrier-protein] synthase III|nr:hypothetical protein [Methylomirabilota bacterium]